MHDRFEASEKYQKAKPNAERERSWKFSCSFAQRPEPKWMAAHGLGVELWHRLRGIEPAWTSCACPKI